MNILRTYCLALLPSLFVFGCSSKQPPEPFWIGHLAQLSGSGKAQGIQAQKGVRLAVDDAMTAGVRVLGRALAVRHVDTRGDGESARAEAVRLITVSKATALLVSADPASAERVGRESLAYGLPVLLCGELGVPPAENVFVLGAGPEPRGRALARCAADEVKAGTVAVLVDSRNPVAGALAAAFVQQYRKTPRSTVQEWEYQNAEEFKERIGQLLKTQPGTVLVAGTWTDMLKVRADLHEAKRTVPILFGGEDTGATAMRSQDAEGAEIYLATAFAIDGLSEKGRDFAERFQKATGEPPTLAAALAYDGTRLLFDAMSKANTISGTRVREQLAKIEGFESVTGTLSFKERQACRPIFVVRLKGDAAKMVKTVSAEE